MMRSDEFLTEPIRPPLLPVGNVAASQQVVIANFTFRINISSLGPIQRFTITFAGPMGCAR